MRDGYNKAIVIVTTGLFFSGAAWALTEQQIDKANNSLPTNFEECFWLEVSKVKFEDMSEKQRVDTVVNAATHCELSFK